MVRSIVTAAAVAVAMLFVPLTAAAATSFTPRPWTPQTEAQNFSKVEERQATYDTPGYQVLLRTVSAQNAVAGTRRAGQRPRTAVR